MKASEKFYLYLIWIRAKIKIEIILKDCLSRDNLIIFNDFKTYIMLGGLLMAKHTKKAPQEQTRKPSKRERRQKIIVYVMILAMVGSLMASGLTYIL